MPAPTRAFLDEARRSDAAMSVLVRVALTEPTSRTLYLAAAPLDTPNGTTWEAALVGLEPINAPGSLLSPGPDLCTAGFSMATQASLGWQAAGQNISNLFSSYRWQGATVEIYLWPRRSTTQADILQVYTGIVHSYSVGLRECRVLLVQRGNWDRPISPATVSRDVYPRAPEASVGSVLPIVYGAIRMPPMRRPWVAPYQVALHDLEHIFGGPIGIPAVCVDTGRGGADRAKYLVACHALLSHETAADATTYFLQYGDTLAPITPTALINGATGAGFELGDDFNQGEYPIAPNEVVGGLATPAAGLRYVLDPYDETSYTYFNYTNSQRKAEWRLPDVPPPGDFALHLFLRILYKSTATLTDFNVGVRRLADSSTSYFALPASATPTRLSWDLAGGGDWGSSSLPTGAWGFSEIVMRAQWDSAHSGEEVRIYSLGLSVQFKPKAQVFAPASSITRLRPLPGHRAGRPPHAMLERVEVPGDTAVAAHAYGTVLGLADDGIGTYTGTPASLIETPAAIAHNLLVAYGGEGGRVELGASVHGSFLDARTQDTTWRLTALKHGYAVAERSSLRTHLEGVATSGLSQCILDRYSDKWLWLPWREGSGTTYTRKVYRDDLLDFEVEPITTKQVPSGITIRYGYDYAQKRYLYSCSCSPTGSNGGQAYLGLRDERFAILADINDRLQLDFAGTTYTHQFAPGDYTAQAFVSVLGSINSTVSGTSVALGPIVVASINDHLHAYDGGNIAVNIPAAVYATMEALAVAVAAALNSVSTNWYCTYSRTTRKYTVGRTAGSAELRLGGNQEVWVALGFTNAAHTGASSYTSDFPVDEELLTIANSGVAHSLKFATGTYGSEGATPKHAAQPLGFDPRRDTDVALWHSSDSYKSHRELLLAAGGEAYGFARDLTVNLPAVYDTDTAREARNRYIEWLREPRVVVRFSTWRLPDLQRGQLLRFEDLDYLGVAYPKRGTNGLWAGRSFRVLSMVQHLDGRLQQVVECVDNDALGLYEHPVLGTSGGFGQAIMFGDLVMPPV